MKSFLRTIGIAVLAITMLAVAMPQAPNTLFGSSLAQDGPVVDVTVPDQPPTDQPAINQASLETNATDTTSSVPVSGVDATTWAVLLGALSTLLTFPLTNRLRDLLKTDGLTTQSVNVLLNAVIAGLLPWIKGLYPPDPSGLLFALLATILGSLADKGFFETLKQFLKPSASTPIEIEQ
jgi:hypothetical protein